MKHIPALDGLRGVAVLSVMTFHVAPQFALGGSLGVDIFFVLSGWLITSILIKEAEHTGTIDYRAFVLRRARRLIPGLAVLLVAYVVLAPLFVPQVADRRWLDAATAALYLTNLRQTFWPIDTPLSHTWSLAIEEQFYLLWPYATLGLLHLTRRHAALVLCVGWAVLTIARVLWHDLVGGPGAYYFTPLHSTGLLLGAALALNPLVIRRGALALALLIAMVIGIETRQWFLVVQPIAEIATVIVIAGPPRALGWRPLRFFGRISYGIYLWHIPLLWIMPRETPLQIGSLFAASILAGWISHVLVERRFVGRGQPADRARDEGGNTPASLGERVTASA